MKNEKIDYECKGCKRRISEEEYLYARYNYICKGQLNDRYKCDYSLLDYKPIYKYKKEI